MGVSLHDVNLTIIHNGERSHWVGVKTCGHVLFDDRVGIYREVEEPDLSWIVGNTWEEMLEKTLKPLKKPLYGDIVVDFDKKEIIDDNGYGSFLKMPLQWVTMTHYTPDFAPITKRSLSKILKAGLASGVDMLAPRCGEEGLIKLPKSLRELVEFSESRSSTIQVHFKLPDDWIYHGKY